MRIRSLVASAAALLLLLSAAAGKSGTGFPELPPRAELHKKTTKQLKATLRKKGAKCTGCSEKSHYVDRVVETWGWSPKEASTPDGKVRMTRDVFIEQIRASWRRHKTEEDGAELEQAMSSTGHELDGDDVAARAEDTPDFERAWLEFAKQLETGKITKDENGEVFFDVNEHLEGGASWWEKHKMHVMIAMNVLLMFCMYRLRSRERQSRNRNRAVQKADAARRARESAEPLAPGEELPNKDD